MLRCYHTSMKTKLIAIFILLSPLTACSAQNIYDDFGSNGSSAYYDQGGYPHTGGYRGNLEQERYNSRVAQEQTYQREAENRAQRDSTYTELYGSDSKRQERSNVMININEAAGTVRNIANTIQYIQNLF